MDKRKREELEIIAELLYEWAAEYDERYVMVTAFNKPGAYVAMADVSVDSPNYEAMGVYKNYETPAAATARESKD